jgi:hypothetical protein
MTQTLTRLFDTYADAERAVTELERLGVPHSDISIVGHKHDTAHDGRTYDDAGDHAADDASKGASAGGVLGAAGGLLAGLGLLAIPGLGPVVAAGWLASTAVGAVVGAVAGGAVGGIVGALTHAGVSEEDANVYAEGVRRGGTLVSVKTGDSHLEAARTVMDNYNPVNIATRGAAYRASGWSRYDDTAPVYTPDEVAAERSRYL